MNGRTIGKGLIVLVVFPVFAHATFTVATMALPLMMPAVLAMAGNWSEMVGKAALVGAFLLAVRVSFGACRRLWPTTA